MFKRVFSVILCLALMSGFAVSARAEAPALKVDAPAAILVEAETGKVLFEKHSRDRRACASITKVMTLLLVMEAVDSGRLSLSDTLTSSAHAASMGGSDIWLEEGEEMTADDLIKATAVASANDAAVVLAERLSGSEDAFVAEMNKKAKELGMTDTVFKNCNGLDEKGHLTSARDIALMSRELIRHKKIFDYTSIWLDELRGGKTQIVNTNKLLKTYPGITGLKTGTTGEAGCCMSATAERDGLSLVAVVLGCTTGTSRFADSAALLDYGFANYTVERLKLPKNARGKLPVEGGMTDEVEIDCPSPGSLIVGRTAGSGITRECRIKKEIKAPVKKGEVLGEVNYYLGKDMLKSLRITAKEAVEEVSFGAVLTAIFGEMLRV